MKVLLVLTYYHPHVSGLTIYVKRLATMLAQRGHQVTVLTSRYDPALPAEEVIDGVHVVRAPVQLRVSKGVIMLSFPMVAWRLIREHDVLSVHLPQFEASLLGLLGRLANRPVILTYHCDLQLPRGWFNRIVDKVVFASNYLAGQLAQAIVGPDGTAGGHGTIAGGQIPLGSHDPESLVSQVTLRILQHLETPANLSSRPLFE